MGCISKDAQYDDLFADVRARLSEHFPNLLFVVMDDDGDLYYDYTNIPVGKMLAREMLEDMTSDSIDIDWEEDDDEDWIVDEDDDLESFE